jgi:hypothetical protein
LYDYSDRGISEKYYSLEFSSLTIVVNSEHFITSKHERNSMKKIENVNLLILGSRTDPGFITTLNKMLWSATGALKPMDQKNYICILL